MSDVFISYSVADLRFVERLYAALAANYDIWLDRTSIPPAVPWKEWIHSGIDQSDNIIVIVSPDSMTSDEVIEEVAYAADLKKRILPILYREVDWKQIKKPALATGYGHIRR